MPININLLTKISIGLFCRCEIYVIAVYPYEYIHETLLPENEDSYSHLNIQSINDEDFKHAKRVSKDFKIKNLGQ